MTDDAIRSKYKYQRSGDLKYMSRGGQAFDIDLVKRIGDSKTVFVRKVYKFGSTEFPTTKKAQQYMLSEYDILRKLSHTNIVSLEDCEYLPQLRRWEAYLYMEYCPSGDLSRFSQRGTNTGGKAMSLSIGDFWSVSSQLASALVYCHIGLHVHDGDVLVDSAWKRPVLHRDIKPQNGRAKIASTTDRSRVEADGLQCLSLAAEVSRYTSSCVILAWLSTRRVHILLRTWEPTGTHHQ